MDAVDVPVIETAEVLSVRLTFESDDWIVTPFNVRDPAVAEMIEYSMSVEMEKMILWKVTVAPVHEKSVLVTPAVRVA